MIYSLQMKRLPQHHILFPPQTVKLGRKCQPSARRAKATTKGRRRTRVSPAHAAAHLTPLYQALLKEIYAAGYMRTDQIEQMLQLLAARLHLPLPQKALRRVVQRNLRRLVKAGLLQRIVPPVDPTARQGPPFYIYTLTTDGARIVAHDLGVTLAQLGWRGGRDASHLFLQHTLALVDHKLCVMQACRAHAIELVAWHDDRILKRTPARVQLKGEQGTRIKVSVVPDAYYRLRLPSGQQLACCVEIDRGTTTVAASTWQVKSWRRKILAYQALQQQPAKPGHWTAPGFIVTTVTTSAPRLAHLLQVCAEVGGDHHFWFTTFDAVRAATVLQEPVWRVVGQGIALHRLLPQ